MTLPEFIQAVRDLAVAIAALVGALLAWQRLRPAAQQATAAEEQSTLAQRAYVTEQLRLAAADLRADRLEVRLAAVYILRQIGRDYPSLSSPVVALLDGYLRNVTDDYGEADPPPDVVAVATVLRERTGASDET